MFAENQPDKKQLLPPEKTQAGSSDGTFSLQEENGDLYLTVFPPQAKGKPVHTSVIFAEIKMRIGQELKDVFPVFTAVEKATGEPVKIYDQKTMQLQPEISLRIAADGLSAEMVVIMPPKCRPLVLADMVAKLEQENIIFGINQDALQTLVEKQKSASIICARGIKPVNGSNAYLKYLVDTEHRGQPVELEDGRVDYKNVNYFIMIKEGQRLLERVPLTVGVAGMDIFGRPLAAKEGKNISLQLGKNVKIEAENYLVAAADGHYNRDGDKISVLPYIEINGDVDYSTGNIDFSGSVLVRGSVNTGFSVKAEGSVDIFGSVVGGNVQGHNITVRSGIQGRAVVKAENQLVAKFVENASISAYDILINDVILHSQATARRKIVVSGRRGMIAGGQVVASEEIQALVIGTASGVHTKLVVGQSPELRQEYFQLQQEFRKKEIVCEQNDKILASLNALDLHAMPPEKTALRSRLIAAQYYLKGQLQEMHGRITEIEMKFEEMSYAVIKIMKTAHAGVVISIGNVAELIRETLPAGRLYMEEGVMKIGPLQKKATDKSAGRPLAPVK